MDTTAFRLETLIPPKDDLFAKIRNSKLSLKDGDIVAVSSKVVSIHEGRCVPISKESKLNLIKKEADWYLENTQKSRDYIYRTIFTVAGNSLVGSAGVDESNGNDHYILFPEDPMKSAKRIHSWLKKEYGVGKLGVIITDSMSVPLRRGAIGFALSWYGFLPLRDYRGQKDIFGRAFKFEVANIADALAASAVLSMGEGNEQMPVARIRGAAVTFSNKKQKESFILSPKEDLFAPILFLGRKWRKGKKS